MVGITRNGKVLESQWSRGIGNFWRCLISLLFEEPIGIPMLSTDEGEVAQILRNFISNALKYTEHGEVRVAAALGSSNTVVFSVADTGIGIAPEDQKQIFD